MNWFHRGRRRPGAGAAARMRGVLGGGREEPPGRAPMAERRSPRKAGGESGAGEAARA